MPSNKQAVNQVFSKSFLVRLLENTWLLSVYYIEYNQMSINGMINRWTLMDPVILSFTFIYNSTTFSHRKLKGKVLLLWIKVQDKIMRSIYVHTYFWSNTCHFNMMVHCHFNWLWKLYSHLPFNGTFLR